MPRPKPQRIYTPMGAPTAYKPEYADKMLEYFSVEPYYEHKRTVATKMGPVEITENVANDFPTFAGFAILIDVDRVTLYNWAEKHPEFAEAMSRARDYQQNFLIVNGNKGLLDSQFGIFTTKAICGLRDKDPEQNPNVNVAVQVNGSKEDSERKVSEVKTMIRGVLEERKKK